MICRFAESGGGRRVMLDQSVEPIFSDFCAILHDTDDSFINLKYPRFFFVLVIQFFWETKNSQRNEMENYFSNFVLNAI